MATHCSQSLHLGPSGGLFNRLLDMAKAEPFAEHHLTLGPHQAQLHLLQQPSVQQISAGLVAINALLSTQGDPELPKAAHA